MRETANYNWEVLKTPIRFKEISAPNGATIPDDSVALYAKDKAGTSNLYFMDDAGVEHDLSTITGQALTRVNDTNVTLTLGGSPLTALVNAASLTLGWTGTLSLARGGTAADLSATGGAGKVLKQSSAGAAITVATLAASDIASGAALTKTDDTNVTLTLGGTPASALLAATSLTLGWTGTLGVARGGTNIGSYAVGDLLYASGATTLAKLADVAAGSYLRSGGVTTAPLWSTLILPNSATANRIVYATGSNTLGESANLAYDGTDFLLGSGTRARMSGQNRFRHLNTMCRAVRSTSQSINSATFTSINLDGTETFDTDSMHDTVTNNTRVVCNLTGKYLLVGLLQFDTNGTGNRILRFLQNGSSGAGDTTSPACSGINHFLSAVQLTSLTANDYIELQAYQDSGVSLNVASAALAMVYLGE